MPEPTSFATSTIGAAARASAPSRCSISASTSASANSTFESHRVRQSTSAGVFAFAASAPAISRGVSTVVQLGPRRPWWTATRSAISLSRASAVATYSHGEGSAITKLSAYRLLPDRAPPSTSVSLLLAAADPAKTLRAGDELSDQSGKPDPDDHRPGQAGCDCGDTVGPAPHEQRGPDGERALDDDEAQQVRMQRRSLRPEDGLAKRIAVEEAGSSEKDCPQRDREGTSARDQETCEQHRDRDHDLGTGKVDAVYVQRDADRRGNDEQQRQHETESAAADGHADRQQEGEVIRPDHGMPEAGEEPLGEGRGNLAAHHMMGGGGRRHEEKRDHTQRSAARQT